MHGFCPLRQSWPASELWSVKKPVSKLKLCFAMPIQGYRAKLEGEAQVRCLIWRCGGMDRIGRWSQFTPSRPGREFEFEAKETSLSIPSLCGCARASFMQSAALFPALRQGGIRDRGTTHRKGPKNIGANSRWFHASGQWLHWPRHSFRCDH